MNLRYFSRNDLETSQNINRELKTNFSRFLCKSDFCITITVPPCMCWWFLLDSFPISVPIIFVTENFRSLLIPLLLLFVHFNSFIMASKAWYSSLLFSATEASKNWQPYCVAIFLPSLTPTCKCRNSLSKIYAFEFRKKISYKFTII